MFLATACQPVKRKVEGRDQGKLEVDLLCPRLSRLQLDRIQSVQMKCDILQTTINVTSRKWGVDFQAPPT
jgi:hypothetical protein